MRWRRLDQLRILQHIRSGIAFVRQFNLGTIRENKLRQPLQYRQTGCAHVTEDL